MQLLHVVILMGGLFAQAVPAPVDGPPLGSPIVQPGAPGGPAAGPADTHTTVVENTTVVMPDPNPSLVEQTASDSTPFAMQGGMSGFDKDLAPKVSSFIDFGGGMTNFRNDVIFQPRVMDVNAQARKLAAILMSVALVFLGLWAMMGQAFGSDAREGFEALGRVPLWFLLAWTSVDWFRLMVDAFASVAKTLSSTGHAAFGKMLDPGFWADPTIGLFGLFVGIICLLWLIWVWLDLWVNTCFLAFCLATAPLFIILMATRWTKHWGQNWFRMAPAAMMDIVATGALIGIAGPTLAFVTGNEDWQAPLMTLGLIIAKGRVQRLCGVESHSPAGSLVKTLVISRALHAVGGASGRSAVAPTVAPTPAHSTVPTRAPRTPRPSAAAVSGQYSGTGGGVGASHKTGYTGHSTKAATNKRTP